MSSPTPYEINRRWIEKLIATPEEDSFTRFSTRFVPDADSPTSEHVLRGSKSFAARSFRSRASANSLRVPSTKSNNENIASIQAPVRQPLGAPSQAGGVGLSEIASNGQVVRSGPFKFGPSPTPSMKRKKAEAIVKAHGSPTHVRVTAGGRIVPSEQSPLCHPRYGYSAIKTNGGLIKFAPNHQAGKPQWTRATEDGFVAQDMHGNLCQIVDGTILPLNEVDGALRLYIPAPNLKVTQRGSSLGAVNASLAGAATQVPAPPPSTRTQVAEPSLTSQITALELEYSKLEHELKDVDKTEVIHGRTMGKVAKDALVSKRRELVVSMDNIRKTLKELKNRPPPNAPTSPRAMKNNQSASPSRTRLPQFLQMQQPGNSIPVHSSVPPYSQYFTNNTAVGQYGVQATPSPDEVYVGQSWTMPPASMFVQPPPFDGSMAPPFPSMQPQDPVDSYVPQQTMNETVASTIQGIPQNDGARSSAERYNTSPNRSRAVSIRAPEPKSAPTKSGLNPMSPVYNPAVKPMMTLNEVNDDAHKPVKGRVPTPLSPLHQLQPTQFGNKTSASATNEAASPSKRTQHLQSSSVSSFDTADFFPQNTREYSTRQHAYPFQNDHIEDKENANPEKNGSPRYSPDQNSGHNPQTASLQAPGAPPGTPAYSQSASNGKPVVQSSQQFDIPNRDAHNVSPKSKREWLFIQEHPGHLPNHMEKTRSATDKHSVSSSPSNIIDFSQKPYEWIEGYQAGLQRKAISADRMGKFLDGYCAGLLKSKGASSTSTAAATSTSSPIKPISRRPSPAPPSRNSSKLHLVEQAMGGNRAVFENGKHSLDTLKQAVFAPHNENTVLTPAADEPQVRETTLNPGFMASTGQATVHSMAPRSMSEASSYFPPPRGSSAMPRQVDMLDGQPAPRSTDKALPPYPQSYLMAPHQQPTQALHAPSSMMKQPVSPSLSNKSVASSSIASGSAPNTGNRVTSITSIDTSMYRQWPGSRIMTPTEWKTGSSLAHAAGLATGLFTNAQFDAGAVQLQRVGSVTSNVDGVEYPGRFREGSLDRITSPPTSPAAPMSPRMSPHDTPVKESAKKKDGSPGKGSSPTKAKFEHIAGKVGIKVTAAGKHHDHAGPFEPGSPPDKRRWRDIWRKGGKDGAE